MSIWYAHDDRNSVTRVAERAIWASQLPSFSADFARAKHETRRNMRVWAIWDSHPSKADCVRAKHETQEIWAIWASQLLSNTEIVLGQNMKLGEVCEFS